MAIRDSYGLSSFIHFPYGHNMKQDGSLDPKRITPPLVYTPVCTTLTPFLTPK